VVIYLQNYAILANSGKTAQTHEIRGFFITKKSPKMGKKRGKFNRVSD
jgi:hypothetical protein